MKVYNTMSRKKEEFVPVEAGKVKMYVCGPTVYNYIHIGNARPMVVFDTVRRYLEYKGYDVNYVSNFTDVDDKIINKAQEEGISADEVSKRYIAECKRDMQGLNVKPATTHPLATEEIDGMLEMIQTLIEKGYAYKTDDGTVYYRTRKFPEYGKLSHKNLDELQAGHRDIKVTGEQKEDELDFVLWKPKKEGEPYWESPWCQGRPGWHIECSVMAKKYLGDEIDIHAGGEDLIFPHHENEIAQSEAANGKTFAKYWMHNGFLNIDNQKMSKSAGNFFTVREIAEKYDLAVLRFFMLSAHYRSPLNFSDELMEAAKNGLERILTAADRLRGLIDSASQGEVGVAGGAKQDEMGIDAVGSASQGEMNAVGDSAQDAVGSLGGVRQGEAGVAGGAKQGELGTDAMSDAEADLYAQTQAFVEKFEDAMDDDFNTADAVSAIFELVKFINIHASEGSTHEFLQKLYSRLQLLCDILGIVIEGKDEALDAEVEALIAERQAARKAKDFARADEIRDSLLERGILLEDTREGVKWRKA